MIPVSYVSAHDKTPAMMFLQFFPPTQPCNSLYGISHNNYPCTMTGIITVTITEFYFFFYFILSLSLSLPLSLSLSLSLLHALSLLGHVIYVLANISVC